MTNPPKAIFDPVSKLCLLQIPCGHVNKIWVVGNLSAFMTVQHPPTHPHISPSHLAPEYFEDSKPAATLRDRKWTLGASCGGGDPWKTQGRPNVSWRDSAVWVWTYARPPRASPIPKYLKYLMFPYWPEPIEESMDNRSLSEMIT